MDLLRIGLIGYGVAGSAFHAPLIATTAGLTLTGIVTRNEARAAAAREQHPGVEVVAEVEHLWDLDLDAVTIASPNQTHVPLALAALAAGVNVVVDKPLATSVLDGERLLTAADEAGRLLTVYFNRRWDGDFRTVAQMIREGNVGRVARFESRFERWRPQVATTWKETAAPGQGGGILFDLGPHLIDQALQLFGPVNTVYAEVDTTREGGTNPDDVFLALTHVSGVRSHLFMSATAADLGPRFRVLGTAGGYRVFGRDGQEAALRAGHLPGVGWGAVPAADWGVLSGGTEPAKVPTLAGDYPEFYRRWEAALRGAGPVPVDPADAVAGLRIIEAAEVSSRDRAVVLLD